MKTYIRGGSQFGPLNECGCAVWMREEIAALLAVFEQERTTAG